VSEWRKVYRLAPECDLGAGVAGRQRDDLGLGHLRVEVEVEVLERSCMLEARASQAQLELLAVAALDLVAEQAIEKLAVREVVVDGLAHAQLERLQDTREA
jgi:hypothetical protein